MRCDAGTKILRLESTRPSNHRNKAALIIATSINQVSVLFSVEIIGGKSRVEVDWEGIYGFR